MEFSEGQKAKLILYRSRTVSDGERTYLLQPLPIKCIILKSCKGGNNGWDYLIRLNHLNEHIDGRMVYVKSDQLAPLRIKLK